MSLRFARFIPDEITTHYFPQAAASIFPNKGRSRYQNVHVLLLRWEEDSMGVQYELNDLAKWLEIGYGYAT